MRRLPALQGLLAAAALASCGSGGEVEVPHASTAPEVRATNPVTVPAVTTPATTAQAEPPAVVLRSQVIGRSAQGRELRVRLVARPGARRNVLVVGCVHGNECAGLAITRRLLRATPPPGVALWVLELANPDGRARHTRQNARRVDLNRNFPYRWRRLPRGLFFSGPRPLSEPESRALHGFLRALRPAISIWYHQHADLVDASGGDPGIERRYARLTGMRYVNFFRPTGSITSWQNQTFPRDTAFVVELPGGRLSAAAARRHERAVLALAGGGR